jgi:hypothetical protein
MGSDGNLVGQIVSYDAPVETLDEKCIAVVEQALLSGRDLPYVARASLGLSGPGPSRYDKTNTNAQYAALKEKGISAMISVQLFFRVGVGWDKPLILAMKWTVYSPDGQKLVEADTEETSAPRESSDIADPENEATLVELARLGALDFLTELAVPR